MSLLIASQLGVARGDRTILDDLTFEVAPGEILHFRGRNGVGKTSLIEVLVGVRQPGAGTVTRPDRALFHWVGHRNGLAADLSLEENLLDWCRLNGLDPAQVDPSLERLGLRKLRRRIARSLSMGQKRRGALARLCLESRPLWILDEPMSGLDADGVLLLGELLAGHLTSGGGAFVTSHQPLPPGLPRVVEMDVR